MVCEKNLIKLFIIATVLTLTTNFPSAFLNSSINTAVGELTRFINESYAVRGTKLSKTALSLIRSATLNSWYVSQIFGSALGPFVMDRYGRKAGYITATLAMLFGSIVQWLATLTAFPELLIVGRAIIAFCSPLSDAALIMYLQECPPLEMRGAVSFMCEIGYGLMCFLGTIFGMKVVFGHSLSQLFSVMIFPQILFTFFLFFIPDTPKYLMITRKDRAAALKSLIFFQGKKNEHKQLLDEYAREAESEGSKKGSSLKELLGTWHLRQMVILNAVIFAITTPFYLVTQASTFFFTKANISHESAELSSTGLMLLMALSASIGTTFVDRFPRRALLFSFGGISTTFLLFFVIAASLTDYIWWMKYACIAAMFLYMIPYAMVVGPMAWFLGPELVPQRHRSFVFCFCFAAFNVLISVTNFFSVGFYEHTGPLTFVPLYVIPSYGCLVYLYYYLPETRNRETIEIVEEIKRGRVKNHKRHQIYSIVAHIWAPKPKAIESR